MKNLYNNFIEAMTEGSGETFRNSRNTLLSALIAIPLAAIVSQPLNIAYEIYETNRSLDLGYSGVISPEDTKDDFSFSGNPVYRMVDAPPNPIMEEAIDEIKSSQNGSINP